MMLFDTTMAIVSAQRILLVGEAGAGKSTTGNFLLGRDAFEVGGGLEAVTSSVECVGDELVVCDSPGFGDSNPSILVDVHGLVYVHNAKQIRMTRGSRRALRVLGHIDPRRVLFVFTRSTGSRAFLAAFHEAVCKRGFCGNTTVAFAGTKNVVLSFLAKRRMRKQVATWLAQLPEDTIFVNTTHEKRCS